MLKTHKQGNQAKLIHDGVFCAINKGSRGNKRQTISRSSGEWEEGGEVVVMRQTWEARPIVVKGKQRASNGNGRREKRDQRLSSGGETNGRPGEARLTVMNGALPPGGNERSTQRTKGKDQRPTFSSLRGFVDIIESSVLTLLLVPVSATVR